MTDTVLRASCTQNPTTITSNAFEKSRPRRKARRSCSNCQRAHKTCGNERPCEQCVKRGIQDACVDGNRKPPKYLLCDLPRKRTPSPRAKKHHQVKPFDLTHSWNINTGFQVPPNAGRMHTPVFEEGLAEFIDPTLLHTASPGSSTSPSSGSSGSECDFSKVYTPPSRPDVPFEQNGMEKPRFQSLEDFSRDILSESLALDLLQPQVSNSNMDGYDGQGVQAQAQGRRPSYGFSISSGWSSTFFPCEMDEQPERLKKMECRL